MSESISNQPAPDQPSAQPRADQVRPGLGGPLAVGGGLPPSTTAPGLPPEDELDLKRRLYAPRTLFSVVMSWITGLLAIVAMVPLFSVLFRLVWEGGKRLSPRLLIDLPPAAGMVGGGIGNALLGTVVTVAIATAVSVPLGILAAVFIGELEPESNISQIVRFSARVLTGLPSVLAGLFAYATVVYAMGHYSAFAGGLALAILMLPTVLLTAEQALRMVPARMKEAAVGMGATRSQVVWFIVLPTALPGILTGVMLAVARAAGETAPLLFTALFSVYWMEHPFEPTASLAVLIYNFSESPFSNQTAIAWSASLVLVFLILLANIAAQYYTARQTRR
jgi:phosphate transport system permease protein